MQKLSTCGSVHRFHPSTPEPTPRSCSICKALVPAFFVPSTGQWVEQKCECERALRRQQEAEVARKQLMVNMAHQTYGGWYGSSWANQNVINELRCKSFKNYDTEREEEYQKLQQKLLLLNRLPEDRRGDVAKELNQNIALFENGRKSWRAAKENALTFARNPKGTIIFHGGCGVGKSHLLAAICNALRSKAQPIRSLFAVTPRLFSVYYDAMNRHEEWMLMQQMCTTPFLVFDDLDKAGIKPFKQEVFFQIIDERVTAGLPIGVSTNIKDGQLSEYIGQAAYSRLMVGCVTVEMVSKDYRRNIIV